MKKFNNQELSNSIDDIYQNIKESQEYEAWNENSVVPVEVNFTCYDNGIDEELAYAIDFGDYHSALYTSIDEAQQDFDLIQKLWKKKKIYLYYINSSDEQPSEHVDTLQGHKNNKEIMTCFAVHELKIAFKYDDWCNVCDLISNIPKKKLIEFLPIERQNDLRL